VSDANGQLLKVNAEVLLTIYVGGAAIEYDFLVVKSLSVPLMLGWDFQKADVTTTSHKTQSLTWDNGTVTVAERRWTGNTRDLPPQRGHKPRHHEGSVRVRWGVTVAPRKIQAVAVMSTARGTHLVRERPVPADKRKVLVHNAVMDLVPNRPSTLYLNNLSERAVNVPKGYVRAVETAYNGPIPPVEEEKEVATEEVFTVGGEEQDPAGAAEEVPPGGPAAELPKKPPDKPRPEVDWTGVPEDLRGKVNGVLDEYQDLRAGQLGKVDLTPHRIEAIPGERPRWAQPYRASLAVRVVIAAEVKKQRDVGVISPPTRNGPSRWFGAESGRVYAVLRGLSAAQLGDGA